MRLRIVAGRLGGRVIRVPSRPDVRATSDRVREAWFSALGDRVVGARVIDLFAGSGALGMEALSRGALHADFVEGDRRVAEVLRSNLAALGLTEQGRVLCRDVFVFLQGRRDLEWDVALADPPYRQGLADRLAGRFRERPFAGILCVEHEPGALSEDGDVCWSRRYGETELTFLAAELVGSQREADS